MQIINFLHMIYIILLLLDIFVQSIAIFTNVFYNQMVPFHIYFHVFSNDVS